MKIKLMMTQEANSKESVYKRVFENKLRKTLTKYYSNEEDKLGKIYSTIGCFDEFDPILDWNFKPICGCEIDGYELINRNIKQNRLYSRNGHLLYGTCHSVSVGMLTTVTEGYEMWVLDNMDIVFTYYIKMQTTDDESEESITYRYDLGKSFPVGMKINLDNLLTIIENQVYYARRPYETADDEDEESDTEDAFYGEKV